MYPGDVLNVSARRPIFARLSLKGSSLLQNGWHRIW